MTCKSKRAKIVRISPLKIYFFASVPEPKGQLTRNLVGGIGVTLDQKQLKMFQAEIQDGRLENLFFASSPEQKGQLT